MAIVHYRPGSRLDEYKVKDVVVGVPLSEPALKLSLSTISAHTQIKKDKSWWDTTNNIIANFDPGKFEPLIYCKRCNWIENGGHRLVVAQKLNLPVDVEIRGTCYYAMSMFGFRKNWKPPWMVKGMIPVKVKPEVLNEHIAKAQPAMLEGMKLQIAFKTKAELDIFLTLYPWADCWWVEFHTLEGTT